MVDEISKDEKPWFNSRPLRVYTFKYLGSVWEEVRSYVYIGLHFQIPLKLTSTSINVENMLKTNDIRKESIIF